MRRAHAIEPALRALASGMLAVFLFGSASGPLRTCLSHPGHAEGAHADRGQASAHASSANADAHMAASHRATVPVEQSPTSGHDGCSCLGRCSLEQVPSLLGARATTVAFSPEARRVLVVRSASVHPGTAPYALPLARPPPTVV